jgi:hypothetical protein
MKHSRIYHEDDPYMEDTSIDILFDVEVETEATIHITSYLFNSNGKKDEMLSLGMGTIRPAWRRRIVAQVESEFGVPAHIHLTEEDKIDIARMAEWNKQRNTPDQREDSRRRHHIQPGDESFDRHMDEVYE